MNPKQTYWPALDGLRALAVLAAMAFHAGMLQGGFIGVDVFFVISGFLITTQLQHEYAHTGRIRIGAFLLRRTARLLPALCAVLLFTIGLSLAEANPFVTHPLWSDELKTLLTIAHWSRALDYADLQLLGHTWSLNLEEHFYLLWALLWLLIAKARLSTTTIYRATLALATLSAATMLALHYGGASLGRLYNGLDTRAQALLLGCAMALYKVIAHSEAQHTCNRKTQGTADTSSLQPLKRLLLTYLHSAVSAVCNPVLALALLVVLSCTVHWKLATLYQGGYTLVAMLACIVIAQLCPTANNSMQAQPNTHNKQRTSQENSTNRHHFLIKALSWSPLRYIGIWSYGLYLWHYPLYRLALYDSPPNSPTALRNLGLATFATVLLAVASHHWLETSPRQRANRWLAS
jgi:peptidoglycan/LPS O-acetylase OafA/YrhL